MVTKSPAPVEAPGPFLFEGRRECEAMGARFAMHLLGDDTDHLAAVAQAVCEEVQRLDRVLSRFVPGSEIARINRNRVARVDREVFALLSRCEQARERTAGAFDVCAATGGAGIELDAQVCGVRLLRPEVEVDLGAIGKGYALDRGAELLHRFGVQCALLQAGTSSILAVGDRPWPIDLRHPLRPEVIVDRIELRNCGFSCSAARHPGQQLSDLIDPRTGDAVQGNDACIVLAETAADAEIYSTALLAMGGKSVTTYFSATVRWIDGDSSEKSRPASCTKHSQ